MNFPSPNLESSASEVLDSIGKSSKECLQNCGEKIRNAPFAAVAGAAAVGYLFRFVPIGLLLSGLIRLLLILAKPVIISFGVVKLYEFFRSERPLK